MFVLEGIKKTDANAYFSDTIQRNPLTPTARVNTIKAAWVCAIFASD
jgi:hypothetical protein